jgi:hypothetical protein
MLRHVTVKEKIAILTATIKTMRVFMGLHMQVFAKKEQPKSCHIILSISLIEDYLISFHK